MKIKEMLIIREIFLSIKDSKIPVKAGYQIARFLHNTDMDYEFYQEKYAIIVRANCDKDENGEPKISEDGQSIKIHPDLLDNCTKELNDLLDTEITPSTIKFNIDDLSETGLNIEQLYFLASYIDE